MKKRLKTNGLVMSLATILLAVFPAVFFRKNITGFSDNIAEVFGIVFILLGQLIRVSARGYKSENSKNGNALISGGPYSLVRNPMYLGIFLIGLGVVFMLFQWWVVAIFIAFFIIRYILLIYQEEKKLKSLFPESYPVYCKTVSHRIFPSVNALLERDICEYIPLKLGWIKKEIGSIIAVLSLVLLIEFWEEIKRGVMVEYLKELIGILVVIILFTALVGYLSRCTVNKHGTSQE